ncbi:MAG: hypothetical protein AB1486_10255 [Planctomycetota bacterium]
MPHPTHRFSALGWAAVASLFLTAPHAVAQSESAPTAQEAFPALTPNEISGLFQAGHPWGYVSIDGHAGSWSGIGLKTSGTLQLAPHHAGFLGLWREDSGRAAGVLWLSPTPEGDTIEGWRAVISEGSPATEPLKRIPIHWRRAPAPAPTRIIESGRVRVELYTDRYAFEARLGGRVQAVTFDDVKPRTLGRFDRNHYEKSHGIMINGQGDQYVSAHFGSPGNYTATSPPNMYAPGPPASKNFLAPLRDELTRRLNELRVQFAQQKETVWRLQEQLREAQKGPQKKRLIAQASNRETSRETPSARLEMVSLGAPREALSEGGSNRPLKRLARVKASLGSAGFAAGDDQATDRDSTQLDEQCRAALDLLRHQLEEIRMLTVQLAALAGKGDPGRVEPERGGCQTVVTFRIDGHDAVVAGFGAHFIDVDYPYIAASSLRIFDGEGWLIAEETGFPGHNSYGVFRGLVVVDKEGAPLPVIARVELVNGEEWPGYGAGEGVALDDFVFGTPHPALAHAQER